MNTLSRKLFALVLIVGFLIQDLSAQINSVARDWNELLLGAITIDFARPTVHARNLFHLSVVHYDAWAAYDPAAETYLLGRTIGTFSCPNDGVPIPSDIQAAREEAISFASYRLLRHRFQNSPGAFATFNAFDNYMISNGYDISNTSTDYVTGGPAELGNYIAEQMIAFGLQDGSNESSNYTSLYYQSVNDSIEVELPGNPNILDPNRWQPISLTNSIDQAGNPVGTTPPHLSPEWGNVKPFSMHDSLITAYVRDGQFYQVYFDPGEPAYLDTATHSDIEDLYKWNFLLVSVWQSHLDPTDSVMWDISPASMGNLQNYPQTKEDHVQFYNLFEGGVDTTGQGYAVNPVTGQPYPPQIVPRGDFTRILAEFWADGLDSETPPGHWFNIYHQVSNHPMFEKKWMGAGSEMDDLEFDVKVHFTLGGAMHDAAITAWGIKGWYDYIRPVSAIRYMADQGQSTDTTLANYNKNGIPLIPGYIEVVEAGDTLAGGNNEYVGKIKLYTWRGPDYINDPETDVAGVGWILAENWWPYQRPSFVTPPFAGYISGHSTYSRTAAEVMTLITGTPYFPGGMSNFYIPQNAYLEFEKGPSQDIYLQWATYRDASDWCSLSRIWGGIHPPVDDIPGRLIGKQLGPMAFNRADEVFDAKRPYVTEIQVSDSIINISHIGAVFTMDIVFDEDMQTNFNPAVNFVVDDPLQSALVPLNQIWTNNQTFTLTYSIENAQNIMTDIFVQIKDAENTSGNSQNVYLETRPFAINTVRPNIVEVSVSEEIVHAHLSPDLFYVTVIADEPVNTAVEPVIQFLHADNPESSLMKNTSASSWINDTVYIAAYDVNDLNVTITDIGIAVEGVTDVAGNEQLYFEVQDVFSIDTRNPLLVNYTVNKEILNITNVGQNALQFTFTFDKEMQTNVLPELVFPGTNLAGTSLIKNTLQTHWIDSYTCQVSYNLINTQSEEYNIDVLLSNMRDESGNLPSNSTIEDLFSVDTKRPEVVSLSSNKQIISENEVGQSNFIITVTFSEEMKTDILPVLELSAATNVNNSVQFNIFNSVWTDEFNYAAHFDVYDENIEVEDLSLEVSFGTDLAGNAQLTFTEPDFIDLDTRNPELMILTANTYLVTDATQSFVLVSIFDEEMNVNQMPEFEFDAQQNVGLALIKNEAESNWINATTHQQVFDVQNLDFSEENIGIHITQATDLAGNQAVLTDFENFFEVKLNYVNVAEIASSNTPVLVYPNPVHTTKMVAIEFEKNLNELFIEVFDMDGKLIYSTQFIESNTSHYQIDLSGVSSGVYLMSLKNNEFQVNTRLVVLQ